jgi:hypothetical protein
VKEEWERERGCLLGLRRLSLQAVSGEVVKYMVFKGVSPVQKTRRDSERGPKKKECRYLFL